MIRARQTALPGELIPEKLSTLVVVFCPDHVEFFLPPGDETVQKAKEWHNRVKKLPLSVIRVSEFAFIKKGGC